MWEDILILKKGGINIKKKNRGKFTDYCGGKVTKECIEKGKRSSDPKIRKRATFADNARKWKHKNGGIIKAQEGTVNLYTSHPLSPVGIALNQAKAIAKMKGEQHHLPPGVKEIIGPDGKKVVIRTEPPLQPMGQEVAAWLPGVGDVVEVVQIANDVKNGNLRTAALAAGLMILPGNARKILDKFGVDLGDISTFKRLSDQEWDDMYFQAIDSGDMDLIQTIRDAHFKVKAPNTKIYNKIYHGNRTDKSIISFDKSKVGSEHKDLGLNGFWFIDDPKLAKWEYAFKPESFGKGLESAKFGEVIPTYVNLESPIFLEQKGIRKESSPFGDYVTSDETFLELMDRAKKTKTKDGYVFKLIDSDGDADPFYRSIQNQFVVKNPNMIKRADAITKSDFGKIIPISKRDNFNISDIRYGIAPLILGVGAAKTVSNSNTKEQ